MRKDRERRKFKEISDCRFQRWALKSALGAGTATTKTQGRRAGFFLPPFLCGWTRAIGFPLLPVQAHPLSTQSLSATISPLILAVLHRTDRMGFTACVISASAA